MLEGAKSRGGNYSLVKIGDLYFSFTNPSLFMLLTLSLVLLLFHFVTKNGGGKLVPNAWQSLVELIYDFVPNLVNEQIAGNVKQRFFPCISVTFTFSLFCNPQGMIPYSFTVTSHFLITLGLSFSIFIGITIVGFQRNGLHFLSFSLPAGVPLPLAPFLVLLELIPHCFRALSSGIRLFANMMAGHSSVKILSGSAWTMLCMNDLFYFIGDLGPLFIVLALTGPELGVAISQAHVSTISICIYLNDAINLHQTGYEKRSLPSSTEVLNPGRDIEGNRTKEWRGPVTGKSVGRSPVIEVESRFKPTALPKAERVWNK
ncbi:ATP synthase subunit a [Glycine max]|nr:ATP synthase subunit a [Glycine max]